MVPGAIKIRGVNHCFCLWVEVRNSRLFEPDFNTALDRIRAEKFDLMLLDLSLDPEKAHKWGRNLLVTLRTAGSPIPPTIVESGEAEFSHHRFHVHHSHPHSSN